MIERLQAKRNEEGFTLIELLIVIIVLGILAAIVVFAVGSTRKDSVASSCKTNYKSIELSAEAVNTKMGGYPVGVINLNGTTLTTPTPASATAASSANLLSGGTNGALLKVWPSSSDYGLQYVGAAGGGSFTINVYKANTTNDPTGAAVGGGSGGAVLNSSADCNGL
jgi:general secretion pathway protein G